MKKVFVYLFSLVIFYSCGILIDTEEETFTFTYIYILRNETGSPLEISDGIDNRIIDNKKSFECSFEASSGYLGGLCTEFVEIKIPNSNNGYRCHGAASDVDVEGLCFVEDKRLFRISDGTVFTEIDTRVYEYVLTPDLLENVFELPE